MICSKSNNRSGMSGQGDEPVAALHCSCEQEHKIWGEFWWAEGQYTWVFFDGQGRSKSYTQRITSCPACGQRLERKNLTPEN
jgi:hypothetical protein